MGSFFILMPGSDLPPHIAGLFRSALQAAPEIPGQPPGSVLETDDIRIATFNRRNGSGSPIARDAATGNWLAAIGTWFHRDGYASGEEMRLLEEFQKKGTTAFASHLEGFFAISVWDAKKRTLHVITDLIGSCHCFQRAVSGGIAISNSSLLLATLEPSQLDSTACHEFLNLGVIYEDRTLFREVRKLSPSSIFRFSQGALEGCERYWRIADIDPDSLDDHRASKALWERLTAAASRVKTTFGRLACDLTGGYDSRALVSSFLGAAPAFSTVVSGPSDSPDVVISTNLARLANVPHQHLQKRKQVTCGQLQNALLLTDGEYDLIEYAGIQSIHETLASQFDVSINGSFGEVARGYWWELLFPHTGERQPLSAATVAIKRYAVGLYDASLFPPESRLDLASHMTEVVERSIQGLTDRPNTLQMDQVYLCLRMHRWQGRIASSTNRIWPCLSPFMFRSVLEVMLAASTSARRGSLLIRRMLGEYSPIWANVPLEDGTPCLPVTWKNFLRFSPLLGFYGKKILGRAAKVAGLKSVRNAQPAEESPRMQFWAQEQVQTVLDSENMCLNGLLDRSALNSFLQRSRLGNFPYDAQWNRLLTVEYALRTIDAVRKGKTE